jgi:hypothetical protein
MGTSWSAKGEYMEACSCDFLCPCIPKNLATPATHDFCKVALAFQIESGDFGGVRLDGVRFAMFAQTKAVMGAGGWTSGLVIDSAASKEQAEAIGAIAGAQGGGPLAMFGPLISDFRGVERHPIEFKKDGKSVSVKIEGLLDQAIVGVDSMSVQGDCIALDNTAHPVNKRLNLASAVRNVINAFGIKWQGVPDQNNGHFAPFAWQGKTA